MVGQLITNLMGSGIFRHAIELLIPLMMLVFVFGLVARHLVYYTVSRHDWFASEFEKRVSKFIETEEPGPSKNVSFFLLTKKMLEKAFYESFEIRDRMHRRKKDKIMTNNDRIFLVKQGCAWLVKDILKQVKFLKWHENTPKLLNVTKASFQQNPCFNRIFGIVSLSKVNDLVNILPGLFVIGGIFGTFMGIVVGLPKLGGMNIQDVEGTKQIMDSFLFEVSFAMNCSILGIMFSVLTTLNNTLFSPERKFFEMVEKFENSLDLLWYRSDNNDVPKGTPPFDGDKDSSDTLAQESVDQEIHRASRGRKLDEVRKHKAS